MLFLLAVKYGASIHSSVPLVVVAVFAVSARTSASQLANECRHSENRWWNLQAKHVNEYLGVRDSAFVFFVGHFNG